MDRKHSLGLIKSCGLEEREEFARAVQRSAESIDTHTSFFWFALAAKI